MSTTQPSQKSQKNKSFAALYDLHFGFETRSIRGRRVTRPTHNLAAVKAVFQFLQDFKPDTIILGGDQLDGGPVSHWRNGKPRLTENFRLKDEMDLLEKHVLGPVDKLGIKQKIWLSGNHERFIQDFLDINPGVEGMIEPENYLGLKARGWDFYDQGELFKLGKLHFIHGEQIKGRNAAAKMVSTYRRNIRAGHFHSYEAATDVTPYDRRDYHTGIIVPALSSASPGYMKNRPSNFQQGFLFGWVQPNGAFSDYVVVINQGQFIWNGKKYGK